MHTVRVKTKYLFLILLLTAVFFAYAFSGILYARYIASLDEQRFSLNVIANYNVTFDAAGGTITYPEHDGGEWKNVSSESATKIVKAGSKYGTLPTVGKTGYTFGGWCSPVEYQAVEYLDSTKGGKQYIETGLVFQAGYRYDLKTLLHEPLINSEPMFGSNSQSLETLVYYGTLHYFGGKNVTTEKPLLETDYTISADYLSNPHKLVINDIDVISGATGTPTAKKVYLFGGISFATTVAINSYNVQRIYYFDVTNADGTVMQLRPCVRCSDG